jgi:hypothetical protein
MFVVVQEKIEKIEQELFKAKAWLKGHRAFARRAVPELHAEMFKNIVFIFYQIKGAENAFNSLKEQFAENENAVQLQRMQEGTGFQYLGAYPLEYTDEINHYLDGLADRILDRLNIW